MRSDLKYKHIIGSVNYIVSDAKCMPRNCHDRGVAVSDQANEEQLL